MKTKLKRLPIELVTPGMRVGTALHNHRGDMLLQAGCELSEQILSGLRKRGVCWVVVSVEDRRSEEELAAERAKVIERLNRLFHEVGQNEGAYSLYQLMLEYRLGGGYERHS